jgi:hypothetical protein
VASIRFIVKRRQYINSEEKTVADVLTGSQRERCWDSVAALVQTEQGVRRAGHR